MREKCVQISFFNTYSDINDSMESNKPELVRLLEEYVDIDALIPFDFYRAYDRRTGRKRINSLESFIRAFIIQRLLGMKEMSRSFQDSKRISAYISRDCLILLLTLPSRSAERSTLKRLIILSSIRPALSLMSKKIIQNSLIPSSILRKSCQRKLRISTLTRAFTACCPMRRKLHRLLNSST